LSVSQISPRATDSPRRKHGKPPPAGRPAEALQEIQLAQQRDPLSLPVNTDLGFCYCYTRRYDEAVKQLIHVLGMNPDFPPAHLWLGRTYQEIGRFDEALAAFRRVEDRIHDWPVSIAARGFVAGVSDRPAQALEALTKLKELSAHRFVTSYGVALVHAGLGQNDAAFACLNKAYDERSNWLVWLRLDPRWNGLRQDPRFAHLISRMRFPPAVERLPPTPGKTNSGKGHEPWFGSCPSGAVI
jgi:tetratricopeptide (TPR) repeat protein